MLYNTGLYCTTLQCTALHCIVLFCTVLHCTEMYCTVLFCTVTYCSVLHCTILYCTILHCTVLNCTLLCCTVLPVKHGKVGVVGREHWVPSHHRHQFNPTDNIYIWMNIQVTSACVSSVLNTQYSQYRDKILLKKWKTVLRSLDRKLILHCALIRIT